MKINNCTCEEVSKNSKIVFKDKKQPRKLLLINTELVENVKIRVDGCLLNGNFEKCDYLNIAKNIEMYIELKGKDINHAAAQITNTIKLLSDNPKKGAKRGYIITSGCNLPQILIQNLQQKFRKNYNLKLEVRTNAFEDKF